MPAVRDHAIPVACVDVDLHGCSRGRIRERPAEILVDLTKEKAVSDDFYDWMEAEASTAQKQLNRYFWGQCR